VVILWCDGAHDAVTNMERDAALLTAAESGAEPVLRLFAFDPPGITIGIHQRADEELDLANCRADRIAWARRPTGGRAIFHQHEWTYSFAAPLADPEWGGSRDEAYRRISRLVVASLVRLGVPAELAAARDSAPERDPGPRAAGGPAAPCFASTARHEVVLQSRKLVGSAQRRTAAGLLQQGSVLLGPGHLRLVDYLRIPGEQREPERSRLAHAAGDAGAWLGIGAPLARWADALHAELGPTARRFDGPGALTLAEPPPYTSTATRTEA
jgi:lipoate-protein ligase A